MPGGSPQLEKARRDWAAEFVAAAIDRSLSMVAVTDHHDVTMVPYVREAAATTLGKLLVFPGIEVTCKDSVQCLAIFEPDTEQADLNRFLTKLSSVVPSHEHDDRTAATVDCGLNLAELFERIREDTVLAPRTLLLPHFGNASAHKSLNAEGLAARARELPIHAIYIECAHKDLDPGTLDKIQGRAPDWGGRRLAVIATGDNKRASWGRLGHHEYWIRTGERSLEALRQAFLADEARIAYSRPSIPTERVLEMEVMSTLTGEQPVHVTFNEGFNAFIGGRGSGNSAMLEYLAFGLGNADADRNPTDNKSLRRRERERALIDETLKDGWVAVAVHRSGVRETWRRTGAKPEEIVVSVGGIEERLNVQLAQARFPARTFHQKELSTTMVDLEAAADNITLIAAAEAINERRRLEQDISNAKRSLATALMNLVAHWQSEVELMASVAAVADLERRIAAVKDRLEIEGVTGGDIAILEDARRFDRGKNYLAELQGAIAGHAAEIGRAAGWQPPTFVGAESERLPFTSLSTLLAKVERAGVDERVHLTAVTAILVGIEETRAAAETAFAAEQRSFAIRYDDYKVRQDRHRTLISESEQLGALLKEALTVRTRATTDESAKRGAVEKFEKASTALAGLVAGRHQLLRRSAAQIAEKSEGALKARVSRDRKPAECTAALCGLMENSRFRDPEGRCGDWVGAAFAEKADPHWDQVCSGLLGIYRAKIMAGSPAEPPASASAAIAQTFFNGTIPLTAAQAAKVYGNLSDDTIGAVLSATPRDSIVLTYVSEGQSIPFERASPGQQASALLRLLLRQAVGTLVIDQPEDDLDNRVMMEIVQLVRQSKNTRQLIFSTHNPNLVVNGDADKVVVMRATVPEDRAGPGAARIRAELDGAIETPAVRLEITRIMEGGLDAFSLRSRKYGTRDGREVG